VNNVINTINKTRYLVIKLVLLATISLSLPTQAFLGFKGSPCAYIKKKYSKAKNYINSNKKLKTAAIKVASIVVGAAIGVAIGCGAAAGAKKLPKKAQKPVLICFCVACCILGFLKAAYFDPKRQKKIPLRRRRKNYYDILGLKYGASNTEIKKAYRKLAMEWHPDTVNNHHPSTTTREATEKLKLINEAYEMLIPKVKKRTIIENRTNMIM